MKNNPYEEAVKQNHPDARLEKDGVFWFVSILENKTRIDIGAGFSSNYAWYSAYTYLSKHQEDLCQN